MGILGNVILVLTIGITVIVTAYCIIQKIYDENRKNSKHAEELISDVFNSLTKAMLETYDGLVKREEERNNKKQAEWDKRYNAEEE